MLPRPAVGPPLVVRAPRELLKEIRVASLHHFARERRLDQLHLGVVGLLVMAAVAAVIVSAQLVALAFAAAAAAAHAFSPWRRASARHGAAARRLFALGRELYRAGPALTPAAFCALRVRVDLALAAGLGPARRAVAAVSAASLVWGATANAVKRTMIDIARLARRPVVVVINRAPARGCGGQGARRHAAS